jgi:hypothetical protein
MAWQSTNADEDHQKLILEGLAKVMKSAIAKASALDRTKPEAYMSADGRSIVSTQEIKGALTGVSLVSMIESGSG